MPHTRSIETTLATCSLVGGLAANFAGLLLIGRLPWQLSAALVILGTSALVGAMLLVAAADRKHAAPTPPRLD
jgi:uncharacterized membrane protein